MVESNRYTSPARSVSSSGVLPTPQATGAPRLDLVAAKCWAGRGIRVATPLETWVDEAAKLAKPDGVVYCDGSEAEYQRRIAEMLRGGDSYALNEKTYPDCYLHRSSPNDVARTEHL